MASRNPERILHPNIENAEVVRRVNTMRENGALYQDVRKRYSADPDIDPRYEKKYAEFNAAAFGLAAAGFTDLNFVPRESPDFEVREGDSTVAYMEVVSVKEDGDDEYDGLLDQCNVALRRRAQDDPDFAAKIARSFCEIVLAGTAQKNTRHALVSEVVRLFENENLVVQAPTMAAIGERYPILHACRAQYVAVPARGASHLSFRKPPQAFSDLPVANAVLSRLDDKRASALRYTGSPLWLMMYCEVPGTAGALNLLQSVDFIEIHPFQRVFVGGQRQVLELRVRQ